jgi:diaminohydroxyphosphoribosylaminopyrimidine deaminase/5-amino-6-(5-phosphoribosylamino)uracil reductase
MHLRLPLSLNIFDKQQPTIIFNALRHEENGILKYYQVTEDVSIVHQILNACYQNNIQSIIVEGGAKLLQSFIDEKMWDEARVITNKILRVEDGLNAPELFNFNFFRNENIFEDVIDYYQNQSYPY